MALEYRLRVTRIVGPNGQTGKDTIKDSTGSPITSEADALQIANAVLTAVDVVQVVVQSRDVPGWADGPVVGELPPKPTKCETCGQPLP
jgi:hypothetical protein